MFFEYLQYSNKRLIISADKVTIFFVWQMFLQSFKGSWKNLQCNPKINVRKLASPEFCMPISMEMVDHLW